MVHSVSRLALIEEISMANSIIVTMVAVTGKEESKPFRMYLRDGFDLSKKNTVVRLDNGVDRNNNEVLTISNSNVGLIVSHNVEYIEGVLTGFRRKVNDNTFIIVKPFKADIASETEVNKAEAF